MGIFSKLSESRKITLRTVYNEKLKRPTTNLPTVKFRRPEKLTGQTAIRTNESEMSQNEEGTEPPKS